MNKYLLTFKDQELEQNYQTKSLKLFRMSSLCYLTIGLVIISFVRIIQCGIVKEYEEIYKHICIVCYLIFQCSFIYRNQKYIRIGMIILNHTVSIFYEFVLQDQEDSHSSFIKGANLMGTNFLLFLTGEFMDSAISVITLTLMRLISDIIQTNHFQFSIIVSSLVVVFFVIRITYYYHKAVRSEYLLMQIETHWENILNSISFKQPYIVYSFNEEILHFDLKCTNQNCKIFNQEYGPNEFLKDAYYKGDPLRTFLFNQIKIFGRGRIPIYNRILVVNYLKKSIKMECSIFFGNKPTILILFKDYLIEKQINNQFYKEKNIILMKLLMRILNKLNQFSMYKNDTQIMRRKLLLINLYDKLNDKQLIQREINMISVVNLLNQLYPNLSIKIFISDLSNFISIPNIFLLICLLICEHSKQSSITINIKDQIDSDLIIEWHGLFQYQKLEQVLTKINDYQNLIFESICKEENKILMKFHQCVNLPYLYNELFVYSKKAI